MEALAQYWQPPIVYAVGGFIVAAATAIAVLKWRASNRGVVPFKSEGGRVEVAPHTIRSFLQHVVSEVDGVEKAQCTFKQRGPKLQIDVKAKVQARLPLRTIETEIKRSIRASMRHQFNMTNVDPINIRITQISGQPMEKVPSEETWETTDALENTQAIDGSAIEPVEPLPERR